MKAPTSNLRFNNASTLLDYGFTNFQYKSLAKSGEIIQSVNIPKGIPSPINAIVESNCGTLINKGNDVNLEQNISINNSLSAPISAGQTIGEINYVLDGETICKSNLIASDDVNKIGILSMSKTIFSSWANLLR